MAKVKKVDPKVLAKRSIVEVAKVALENAGFAVLDGEQFGFTSGTIVVRGNEFDVQLKPVAPKAGVTRYQIVEEEEA